MHSATFPTSTPPTSLSLRETHMDIHRYILGMQELWCTVSPSPPITLPSSLSLREIHTDTHTYIPGMQELWCSVTFLSSHPSNFLVTEGNTHGHPQVYRNILGVWELWCTVSPSLLPPLQQPCHWGKHTWTPTGINKYTRQKKKDVQYGL